MYRIRNWIRTGLWFSKLKEENTGWGWWIHLLLYCRGIFFPFFTKWKWEFMYIHSKLFCITRLRDRPNDYMLWHDQKEFISCTCMCVNSCVRACVCVSVCVFGVWRGGFHKRIERSMVYVVVTMYFSIGSMFTDPTWCTNTEIILMSACKALESLFCLICRFSITLEWHYCKRWYSTCKNRNISLLLHYNQTVYQ